MIASLFSHEKHVFFREHRKTRKERNFNVDDNPAKDCFIHRIKVDIVWKHLENEFSEVLRNKINKSSTSFFGSFVYLDV